MAGKKKKKRVLKIKNILIFFIVILIIGLTVYYAFKMPIKNIYISGNDILSDDVIINESKLVYYPSFLLTSSRDVVNILKKDDYIRDVSVGKKLGNVIDIKVLEYKPIAIFSSDNKLILSSGKIVNNVYNVSDVPVLNNNVDSKIFSEFVKRFGQVDSNILRQVSQIEYSPVSVDKMRFLLYMDDGNSVYITLTKIKKLNKYNKIRDKMGNKKGIIYLDSGDYVDVKSSDSNSSDTSSVTDDANNSSNSDNLTSNSSSNDSDNSSANSATSNNTSDDSE